MAEEYNGRSERDQTELFGSYATAGYATGTRDGGNGSHNSGQSFRERARRFVNDATADPGNDANPGTDAATPTRKQRSDSGTTRRRRAVKASPLGDLITEGLGALTGVMAISRGAHWNIPPDKLSRVGSAYGAVIDYYFPSDRIGETSLVTGAVLATAVAFGPPVTVDFMRARAAAAAAIAQQRAAYQQPTAPPAFQQPPSWGAPPPPQPAYAPPTPAYEQSGNPADLFAGMTQADIDAAMGMAQSLFPGLFGASGSPEPSE